MVSIYEVKKDKYGEHYISYGKKHRIKTLIKNNIDFKFIYIFGQKHIRFGYKFTAKGVRNANW